MNHWRQVMAGQTILLLMVLAACAPGQNTASPTSQPPIIKHSPDCEDIPIPPDAQFVQIVHQSTQCIIDFFAPPPDFPDGKAVEVFYSDHLPRPPWNDCKTQCHDSQLPTDITEYNAFIYESGSQRSLLRLRSNTMLQQPGAQMTLILIYSSQP